MKRAQSERGFTLYEFLVSTLIVAVALMATMLVTSQMGKQLGSERGRVTGADNARVALDEVTRILRAAGSQADQSQGQSRFVYAGPWTVGLNANLFPVDDEDPTAVPAAVDPDLENAGVPLGDGETYTPPRDFETGAETIVLSVDSNRDGTVSTGDGDDDEEEDSDTPNDLVLKSFVYGSDGVTNSVTTSGLALLRGPAADEDGAVPQPLFQYWLDADNDAETPAVLHGDLDADGQLSQTEIAGLTAVPADELALISRIQVTATTEGEHAKKHGDWNVLESSVSFRNRQTTAARVMGIVYNDYNENGSQDSGEVPIAGVVVRMSNGMSTKTNVDGRYNFVLVPGPYTITEADRVGYQSTTPNTVAIEPAPGDYVEVNFGDLSTAGTGFIHGLVYNDRDRNSRYDYGRDRGLPGMRVFLDTGVAALTDTAGEFLFTVPVSNYTVTEVDSSGYASSTPNVVEVTLAADGDSVQVTFGDYLVRGTGEIVGIVYLDEDNDQVHDKSERGIANVTLTLENGDVTQTDATGAYTFVVEAGPHEVTETDPPGHTSSTVNTLSVEVVESQQVQADFGDIAQQDVTFQEITLAQTERALSITAADLKEDSKLDPDMVLGTHYVGGTNDILAWWNARKNSGTPNSGIFALSPSYQRVLAADVNAVVLRDLNNDGAADVLTGLGAATSNVAVWVTQTASQTAGQMPTSPTVRYTASMAMSVNDLVMGHFDTDAYLDFAIGTTTGFGTGRVEIWHGRGGSSFTHTDADVYTSVTMIHGGTIQTVALGEVVSLAAGNFNGDALDDLVVGTRAGTSISNVYLLVDAAGLSFDTGSGSIMPAELQPYVAVQQLSVYGALQDVLALDMMEDNRGDADIVLATALSSTSGNVQVWHNEGDFIFGISNGGTTAPSDQVDAGGAPLCLVTARVDNDVFPDIAVGTRTSTAYVGQVMVYRAFGFLPEKGASISSSSLGEVVTMTSADFNMDGAPDLATGTRNSVSSGKVVVFYNQRTLP